MLNESAALIHNIPAGIEIMIIYAACTSGIQRTVQMGYTVHITARQIECCIYDIVQIADFLALLVGNRLNAFGRAHIHIIVFFTLSE